MQRLVHMLSRKFLKNLFVFLPFLLFFIGYTEPAQSSTVRSSYIQIAEALVADRETTSNGNIRNQNLYEACITSSKASDKDAIARCELKRIQYTIRNSHNIEATDKNISEVWDKANDMYGWCMARYVMTEFKGYDMENHLKSCFVKSATVAAQDLDNDTNKVHKTSSSLIDEFLENKTTLGPKLPKQISSAITTATSKCELELKYKKSENYYNDFLFRCIQLESKYISYMDKNN
ncbi:hypothetical protein [Vibrio sp. RE88]|uniref:hypothetical protein n=1 Tax=Vibrio sp. RE88 TaxID=2607610 RepID=UPI0014937509|nr:hypothetical protein [Vibrio sp. RE88]NOH63297.1 hypothetical protein [Vibrio sp. RE88]